MDLNLTLSVQLQPGGVHKAHISNVVFATNTQNHELSLPQLLVIWDVVVTCLTFSKLEQSSVTVESYVQSLELLCVRLVKAEDQSLVWDLLALYWNVSSAEVDFAREEFDWGERKACAKLVEDCCWVVVQSVQAGKHLVVSVLRATILTIVQFVLACQGVVAFKSLGLGNQSGNFFADERSMSLDTNNIVALSHHGIDIGHSSGVKAWYSIDLCELSEGLDELIRGASHLGLEEGEPELESVFIIFEMVPNGLDKVCVNNVFHVDGVEVIGPWVQDLEALVTNLLLSVSLDIVFQELIGGLVSLDWVAEIVLIDGLVFSQERSNGLDA